MTTGEYLVSISTLGSGTALDHLQNIDIAPTELVPTTIYGNTFEASFDKVTNYGNIAEEVNVANITESGIEAVLTTPINTGNQLKG